MPFESELKRYLEPLLIKQRRGLLSKRNASTLLLLSLLLSLAIALFVEQRVFWGVMAINDDVRNQAYWMTRITDPTLFSRF